VKVLDFGIAKFGGEATRLTRAGSVFGTPHYMSPEQAAGLPVDARTDIYSLGVILYEMASGKVPFDADNFMGILTQHMYKAPAPIRALVPQPQDVPPGLEAIVLKALSKKADLRYPSMDELLADLDRVERGMVPEAVSEMMGRSGGFNVPADYFRHGGRPMWPATAPPPRRRGVLLGVLVGAVLLVAVVVGVLVVSATGRPVHADTYDATSARPPVAVAAEPPPVVAPVKSPVVVTTDPIDATIALDDAKGDAPQPQPRTFLLGEDEKVTLRVERPGYRTIHYALDAKKVDPTNPRVAIRLEKEPVKPATKPPPPATTPKPPASVAPAPASTVRPAWCPVEEWDMFKYTCRRSAPR